MNALTIARFIDFTTLLRSRPFSHLSETLLIGKMGKLIKYTIENMNNKQIAVEIFRPTLDLLKRPPCFGSSIFANVYGWHRTELGIANAYEKDRSNNANVLFRQRIEKQFVSRPLLEYFKILLLFTVVPTRWRGYFSWKSGVHDTHETRKRSNFIN